MADSKDYISHPEDKGSINISEEVIAKIACAAAREIEGVDGMAASKTDEWYRRLGKKITTGGVKLQFDGDKINIDVYIIVKLDYPLSDVAVKVQEAVVSAVESTTGFAVATANVHVSGIALK